jgi:hypothetical protein
MILEMKAVKNELESYCYDIKSHLEPYGNLEKYLEEN